MFVDISTQMHELATTVYQIRGHIKGKTLLPFPPGVQDIDVEERRARESEGKDIDTNLRTSIEEIILKWSYQVRLGQRQSYKI